MAEWRWEYDPTADHVIGGIDDLALIARIEETADELVRAAAAQYLDGTLYQGSSPKIGEEVVTGGMFIHQAVPRHQCVYILQVTVSPY
ncbi:hypothetical protein A6A06_23740 [Streptomyces sp. CB02923]|uniref:hypothetical protein n=1 Tax=Streptomyces sp. CB02923 TaxID=1718985 RepID=UPI00093A3C79|nr:hypothetical protein [Streptomyces sp. CB02923]OKI00178.1 hypothetical protein A6A06_23740 [Streptomyces sp. CB02923]